MTKRRIGYIRLSRAGPSRKAQEEALCRSGFDEVSGRGPGREPIYVDAITRTSTRPEDRSPERAKAISALRPGDELVISTPSRLGSNRADVLRALEAIGAQRAALYVVSMKKAFTWTPEALAIVEFATFVESENAAEVAKKMRTRKAELGSRSGPMPKLIEGTPLWDQAQAAWADKCKSANQVAKEIGVSVPTLHRRFGPKGTPRFGGRTGRKSVKT